MERILDRYMEIPETAVSMIENSFLTEKMKRHYLRIIRERVSPKTFFIFKFFAIRRRKIIFVSENRAGDTVGPDGRRCGSGIKRMNDGR